MKALLFHGRPPVSIAPRPHQVRMRGYRPVPFPEPSRAPLISGSPKMAGNFTFDAIPLSVGLAGGGIGVLYLSSILPSPIGVFGKVAGIGLLTGAFLNLFTGTAQAEGAATDARRFPLASETEFNLLQAQFIEPPFDGEVSRGAFSYDYDVIVRWVNPSNKPVAVTYDIIAEEEAHNVLLTDPAPWKGTVYSGVINLPPKDDGGEALIPLELDLKTPAFGAPDFTIVRLQLRKYSQSGQPIVVATNRFVVR